MKKKRIEIRSVNRPVLRCESLDNTWESAESTIRRFVDELGSYGYPGKKPRSSSGTILSNNSVITIQYPNGVGQPNCFQLLKQDVVLSLPVVNKINHGTIAAHVMEARVNREHRSVRQGKAFMDLHRTPKEKQALKDTAHFLITQDTYGRRVVHCRASIDPNIKTIISLFKGE